MVASQYEADVKKNVQSIGIYCEALNQSVQKVDFKIGAHLKISNSMILFLAIFIYNNGPYPESNPKPLHDWCPGK